MVDEMMRKRIIEGKRDEIRVDYLAALEDRAQGRIQSLAPSVTSSGACDG